MTFKCYQNDFSLVEHFLFLQEFDENPNLKIDIQIIETKEIFSYSIRNEFNKYFFVTC